MTEELKPCPFCGGTEIKFAVRRREGTGMHHEGDDIWGLNCTGCGASHPNRYNEYGRKLLIKEWNTRAALQEAEPAAAEGQAGWISVDDQLPELGVLVFGLTEGGALSVFCRDDGGGEGWLWAQQHWAWNIAAPEGIECDDDYDVKFWRPMFAAPLPSGQQEGGKR
jgi:Lar family restriction alleviation protein